MTSGSSLRSKQGIAFVLATALVAVSLFASMATAGVESADITPGYRADPAWDFGAFWTLSWHATGTNTWKFTYGDGQSVTYTDLGNGYEYSWHTYTVWCGNPLYKYKYQALKIGSTTYDTSTVKLTKTSTAC